MNHLKNMYMENLQILQLSKFLGIFVYSWLSSSFPIQYKSDAMKIIIWNILKKTYAYKSMRQNDGTIPLLNLLN